MLLLSFFAAAIGVVTAQTFPQETPKLCGVFGNLECESKGQSSEQMQVIMSGITSGSFNLSRLVFLTDGNCGADNPSINLEATGSFIDLGPVDEQAQTNIRKVSVTVTAWTITPNDDNGVNQLNQNCACGGTWASGTTRVLTSCEASACKYPTIFGGSFGNNAGVIVGEPMFTTAVQNGTMYLGRFDAMPATGFSNGVDSAQTPQFIAVPTAACDVPAPVVESCGDYQTRCNPVIDGATGSVKGSAMYSLQSASDASAGFFTRSGFIYSDAMCKTLALEFHDKGAMTIGGDSNSVEGATLFQRFSQSVNVTVYDGDYVSSLNTNCPCGSKWTQGVSRTLTYCASNTCASAPWYSNSSGIGTIEYGVTRYTAVDAFVDLQFSPGIDSQDDAMDLTLTANNLGQDYSVVNNAACTYNETNDICGIYEMTCSADPNNRNYEINGQITATGTDTSDGGVLLMRQFFDAGTDCAPAKVQLSVLYRGFYSSVDNNGNGDTGVLFNYRKLDVVPYDEFVGFLNDQDNGCPCGGKWQQSVERTLTTCPEGTCPGASKFFNSGSLGRPGYGKVKTSGGTIQIGDLGPNVSSISDLGVSINSLPWEQLVGCQTPVPSSDFCGHWHMPCQTDGQADDYVIDFNYNIYTKEYEMNRQDYAAGGGCDATPILTIYQIGGMIVTNQANPNQGGHTVALTPKVMSITPYATNIVELLASVCPCGVKWTVGKTQNFTGACPENTCNDVSWLRQPIGETGYGSMRRLGEDLRMTTFNSTTDGYHMAFTVFDFDFILLKQCDGKPVTTQPWHPTRAPSTAPKKGLDGGDTFVLLFFVFAFLYLAGGMTFNYMQTGGSRGGTPTIPHIGFWRELPGLVADGVIFTFCTGCGFLSTFKGSSSYERMGNSNPEYGAL
eukprot:m.335969 g.335969  ORF g.335969 m.335969 type:complete len:896 (+) comp17725_c0_seq1:97-2784(+)